MDDHTLILIVDPDPEARARIARSLSEPPVVTSEVATAREALEFVSTRRPDVIILDSHLPDISGLGLCRLLRESSETSFTPIVLCTAQDSEIDRVLAFEIGVDDFVSKPFYPPELAARVGAILRGLSARDRTPLVEDRGSVLSVNRHSGLAEVCGKRVDLTPKEFDLLSVLVSQPGRVVRRRELIEQVWGQNAPHSARAVDAHIKSIRRKLGKAGPLIETVRGVGYRYVEANRGEASTPERCDDRHGSVSHSPRDRDEAATNR